MKEQYPSAENESQDLITRRVAFQLRNNNGYYFMRRYTGYESNWDFRLGLENVPGIIEKGKIEAQKWKGEILLPDENTKIFAYPEENFAVEYIDVEVNLKEDESLVLIQSYDSTTIAVTPLSIPPLGGAFNPQIMERAEG